MSAKPFGITARVIGPPIANAAAQKITGGQWLNTMTEHDSSETNWSTFTGGARELFCVLKDQAAVGPARFARLILQLTSEVNSAYTSTLLVGSGDAEVSDSTGSLVFGVVRRIVSLGQADNDRFPGTALQKYYREVPLDLVELILNRVLYTSDPADESLVSMDGQGATGMCASGINTARGNLAEALGNLLIADDDSQRTALVVPYFNMIVSDLMLSVHSCVAHALAASLRCACPEVLAAFTTLIQADNRFPAVEVVQRLVCYIGNVNPEVIDPVIQRVLVSEDAKTREIGDTTTMLAALERDHPDRVQQALSGDLHVRKGTAQITAGRAACTSNTELAMETLIRLMNGDADEVRKEAVMVALHLRDHSLRPFVQLLTALIDLPSHAHTVTQLPFTPKDAPDKVDGLISKTSQRFPGVSGNDTAGIRTRATGDTRYISKMAVRGLARCQNHTHQAALLGVLDLLLELGVYGINIAIREPERIQPEVRDEPRDSFGLGSAIFILSGSPTMVRSALRATLPCSSVSI